MKLRLVIIDDHPLVRKGLISILGSEPSLDVVGEAETLEQALEVLTNSKPDLVLLDLRLGDISGLEVMRQAQKLHTNCKFVILTSSSNEEDFLQAEQLGVSGYLLKEALPEEIINAIKIISRGRKFYDPAILEIKMKLKEKNWWEENLTPREKEVLIALGKGLSNRDIASMIYVTENTVKKHVSQVLAKLNVADRTQAALYAYSKGLVSINNIS